MADNHFHLMDFHMDTFILHLQDRNYGILDFQPSGDANLSCNRYRWHTST